MESKLYAITLGLKGDYYNKILKSWSLIDNNLRINYISSRSPKPHITIISGYSKSEAQIIKKLQNIKIKKFSIRSIGLGLLLMNDPLVFIRWEKNKKLKFLYQDIIKNFNSKLFKLTKFSNDVYWFPKTTVAYKDCKLENIIKLYKNIKDLSKNSTAEIIKLELMSVSLKHGEEIIFSRDL